MVHYLAIRHLIRSGDMLEWRSGGLVGKGIRLFTGKEVNHTSLCLDLDQHMGYKEPHKFILEANAPGIELNLISRSILNYNGKVWWSALKANEEQRAKMERWALLQVGKPYDYKGLFRNILGRVSANARALFCSEFYFISLVVGGLLPWYHFDEARGMVRDENGLAVKAPRPGEFAKYGIHKESVRIV